MRRIHVLFLMEDLCYGGTQRQTLQLAARLDRDAFRPSMLTLTGPTDLDAEAEAGGIALFRMGASRRVDPLFFARLPGWLRRLDPDVIVPCTALPNIWGRLWGCLRRRRAGRPAVVGTVRGGGAPRRQHERWLWRLCDHVVCNTEALRDIMAGFGCPQARLSYIPNGVDTERFAPAEPAIPARRPRILCVARICEDKNQSLLVDAFELVRREHPEALLRFVGDGPWEARLKERLRQSPCREAIELFPGTGDVRPHYAQASVFCLPSDREGQPNVLLEAMACGLPLCATAVGGVPKLVGGEAHGLLSPAGDARALAASLSRLLKHPAEAQAMGRANRIRAVEAYGFGPMVQAHEAIFRRLAEQGSSARHSSATRR